MSGSSLVQHGLFLVWMVSAPLAGKTHADRMYLSMISSSLLSYLKLCAFIAIGQHFDGSGGNGSALRHFEATGRKYPLVVKLGTITPHGADVYSYALDEDNMVIDPELNKHLAHWGINMVQMEKTEKTMNELQVQFVPTIV